MRHLTEGLDFLGFNVGPYPVSQTRTGDKLLLQPSKESVKSRKPRLKREWTTRVGHKAEAVIEQLRPILNGWGNYFKTNAASEAFKEIDHWR